MMPIGLPNRRIGAERAGPATSVRIFQNTRCLVSTGLKVLFVELHNALNLRRYSYAPQAL